MSYNSAIQTLNSKKPFSAGLPLWADKSIALLLILLLSPVFLCNASIALFRSQKVLNSSHKLDALGRKTIHNGFSHGVLKNSATLFQVVSGELRLCGVTCNYRLKPSVIHRADFRSMPCGLVSLHDVHMRSGLAISSPEILYEKQSNLSASAQMALLLRFAFNWIFYRAENIESPALVPLFGLNINNTKMDKAIDWFSDGTFFRGIKRSSLHLKRPKISFFVNANSINLAQRNAQFKDTLKKADCLFADGSGMRLAAKSQQIKLVDNINGTDVLPLLCAAMQDNKKRLYFLGAKPGVAEKAAENLKQNWPQLQICGTQDGYFNEKEEAAIIQKINNSGTDVLLVAQGSPLQESWIIKHARQLNCESILAVGGLFDFYSGDIARAPLWMRETGLEWIWRLSQEPVTKFKRYVIGVPEFMFRTFILKQVCQE